VTERMRVRDRRPGFAARALWGGLVLLVASPCAPAQSPGLSPDQTRAIDALVSGEMSRLNVPGLSVAVANRDGLCLTAAYGLADIENNVPTKTATIFRLASLSKAVTAIAAMQLSERGQLDLDAPIQKYVQSFPEKPWPITTRQLLVHQAGIRHYAEGELANPRHFESLTESLQLFRDSPLLHEPGTKALYSSYGYNLVGCAIEGASGVSYLDFVRSNVFAPAEMQNTRVDDHLEIIPNRARGYFKDSTGQLRNSALSDTSSKIPSGGLCGPAADVGRLAVAFLEGRLVKPETVRRMLTRQKTRDGRTTGYGVGFVVSRRGGQSEAWCMGAQPQVSGTLYLRPDAGVAVAILANLESIPSVLTDLARKIADALER
jgi:serine beta-lactamase-like protein LACTB